MAGAESVLVGLRQSRRRISVRNVLSFRERRGGSDLEVSADVSATGRRAFDCAPVRSRDGRLSTRARTEPRVAALDVGCSRRCLERLDHLLGRDGLVWRARRVRLVAVGVVGNGTRARFAAHPLAISLAGAFRLSRSDRRIPLHGFDAGVDCGLAGDSFVRPNAKTYGDRTARSWNSSWSRPGGAGVARAPRLRSRLGAHGSGQRGAFSMARSTLGVTRIPSFEMDRQLGDRKSVV